jgi:hypothetical protein
MSLTSVWKRRASAKSQTVTHWMVTKWKVCRADGEREENEREEGTTLEEGVAICSVYYAQGLDRDQVSIKAVSWWTTETTAQAPTCQVCHRLWWGR